MCACACRVVVELDTHNAVEVIPEELGEEEEEEGEVCVCGGGGE